METKFKQLHLAVEFSNLLPHNFTNDKKWNLHHRLNARLKLSKSCFVLKIMRSLVFVVFFSVSEFRRKTFIQIMTMHSDRRRRVKALIERSIMLLSLWKKFSIYRRMMCAALLFCVKRYNCCYGMPCNWIKNAFSCCSVLLLNLKCFLLELFNSNMQTWWRHFQENS